MGESDTPSEPKRIHPFFSGPKSLSKDPAKCAIPPVTPDPSCSPSSNDPSADTNPVDESDADENGPQRKRRKTHDGEDGSLPAVKRRPRRPHQSRTSAGETIDSLFGSREVPIAHAGEAGFRPDSAVSGEDMSRPQPVTLLSSTQTPPPSVHTDLQLPNQQTQSKEDAIAKPLKLLKFNPKTGTIGSPPKPKVQETGQLDSTAAGTPTKPRRGRKPKSRIIQIPYGQDEESRIRIGAAIRVIMAETRTQSGQLVPPGQPSPMSTPKKIRPPPQDKFSRKTLIPSSTPKKATHPFFTNRSKLVDPDSKSLLLSEGANKVKSPKRHSIFTSTPCSPKHIRVAQHPFNIPHFGSKSGVLKVPGAQYPAWPWRGVAHIHGDDRDNAPLQEHSMPLSFTGFNRKAKGPESRLNPQDSVIQRATVDLQLDKLADELRALNTDDFSPRSSILRTPRQYFESGHRLRDKVERELRTWNPGNKAKTHPAIVHAYNLLATSLSAFDECICENTDWAHKYSPSSASQVLQAGKEADLLRDWLQALKVMSVDTGTSDVNDFKTKRAAPKKKRKRKKLDGFIVSSDEEDGEMDAISDPDGDRALDGGQGNIQRTVIRNRDLARGPRDTNRLTNAVVLSGPHGCGKTATVYAIAKELDFEVFEISPGSRRSGKDILEKVGDMTRNHLVQHNHIGSTPADVEVITDDELARDLKSGKQETMTAFFRPKATTKARPSKNLAPSHPPAQKPLDHSTKKLPGQSQKQSLILLEEVDVLYEEDKQFWATVVTLMAQSKRPFVMTCNDEKLVPLQSLNLHGIFRFSPPPKDAAVDLLLLVAANEGHALKRDAVETLYESRHCDLRASLMELNYWCQIGIGDVKGGFSWFYPRWPEGIDIDERGDKIRVISTGTYKVGMGWLGRDAIVKPSVYRSIDEEIMEQAWENWASDASDFQVTIASTTWPHEGSQRETSREDRLAALDDLDTISQTMSDADLCSGGSFCTPNNILLDPTLPETSSKVRDDFIIGLQFLDVLPLTLYGNTSLEISSSMKALARKLLSRSRLTSLIGTSSLDEAQATGEIRESFTTPAYSVPGITRADYSAAFDPIAASERDQASSSGSLDPSVFDRTMTMLTLDVAPYVRAIVASDLRLQEERRKRSSLLSEGGKPTKRMRTTRSAMSALEGGPRASTRRERYFEAEINPYLVMHTGGKDWTALAFDAVQSTQQTPASSASTSTDGDMDTP